MVESTDIIVIGTGIAALSLGFFLADIGYGGEVVFITEGSVNANNSVRAQGGMAVEFSDSEKKQQHIADTISAGLINNKQSTEYLLNNADKAVGKLLEKGLAVDTEPNGIMSLRLEGGHSNKRILHSSDQSGAAIQKFLLEQVRNKPNYSLLQNTYIYDLIVVGGECHGVRAIDKSSKTERVIHSESVVLATGGCGHLFEKTSNNSAANGSGVALAKQAGCVVSNMEFIQFHPTAYEGKTSTLLISEALRGDGAKLINERGEELGGVELLTRDHLSRLVFGKQQQGEAIYLDCSNIAKSILSKYSYITKELRANGLDISEDKIPITPVAHYMCGGVSTDTKGETNVAGIYAIGETANTGLHGANRLASNSLTEAITVPMLLAAHITNQSVRTEINRYSLSFREDVNTNYDNEVELLRLKMWQNCGIIRNESDLSGLQNYIRYELEKLKDKFELSYDLCNYRAMLNTAECIVSAAIARKISVGTHYTEPIGVQ